MRIQDLLAENIDIGKEWMTDTELDQYVPKHLEQEWRELVGYDENGNVHPLWINMTGNYEPNSNDPEHRAWMVQVANKWFAMKKIPNVKFFDVKDIDDELEWLVQIGPRKGVAEGFIDDMPADSMVGTMDKIRSDAKSRRYLHLQKLLKRSKNPETIEQIEALLSKEFPHVKQGVAENFADGKKPGRKGLAKRSGVNCKQPVSKLRGIAKKSSGERQRMAHWCANMKGGRKNAS